MNQKYAALIVLWSLFSIAPSLCATSITNLHGIRGQFAFYRQLNEELAVAIEKDISFQDIQKNLLQYIFVADLYPIFASWKLANKNPQEHKKNLESLRAYSLQLHPDKQDECEKLIDSVKSVITGKEVGAELKSNELTPEELEAARSLRKQIDTTVRTILQQGGNPTRVREYLEQASDCDSVKANTDTLEKNRALFCELISTRKMALQKPKVHRAFLASLLQRCIKAHPEQRNNCKIITTILALIYCDNPEEKLIEALANQIPSHKKGSIGSMLADMNLSANLQEIAAHFSTDNLKDNVE